MPFTSNASSAPSATNTTAMANRASRLPTGGCDATAALVHVVIRRTSNSQRYCPGQQSRVPQSHRCTCRKSALPTPADGSTSGPTWRAAPPKVRQTNWSPADRSDARARTVNGEASARRCRSVFCGNSLVCARRGQYSYGAQGDDQHHPEIAACGQPERTLWQRFRSWPPTTRAPDGEKGALQRREGL